MLIHELAKKTGLAVHTIRFYEKAGLIDERFFIRSPNNYRHYTAEAVERLLMIKHGQTAGFTLAEVSQLIQAWDAGELSSEEQMLYIQQKVVQISTQIAGLEQIRTYLTDKLERLQSVTATFEPMVMSGERLNQR
jgi:DNA-binding transcriptional MerR regulator